MATSSAQKSSRGRLSVLPVAGKADCVNFNVMVGHFKSLILCRVKNFLLTGGWGNRVGQIDFLKNSSES